MSPRPTITQVRRSEIVRAALEVISERGFQNLRIADIAERVGTSPSAIHYHFEDKSEILDAAISLAEDTFYAEIEEHEREGEAAAARVVRLLQRGGQGDPGTVGAAEMWNVWLEIWTRALRDRHTARTRQLLDRRWRATLAAAIGAGQARGEFDRGADAELVALQLAALMDGLAIQYALHDPAVTGERMTEVLIFTAERSLACALLPKLGDRRAAPAPTEVSR